jgi:hypothetical protein
MKACNFHVFLICMCIFTNLARGSMQYCGLSEILYLQNGFKVVLLPAFLPFSEKIINNVLI